LTDISPEPRKSPFDRVTVPKKSETSRAASFIPLSAIALALGSVFAANTWIYIPEVEFGRGVENFPECIKTAVVDFDLEVSNSGTTVGALEISNLGVDCNGKYLRVSMIDGSENVIGHVSSAQLSTATTLRLPVSLSSINPANVSGLNFELSDSPF
jgi:hypothetical protein